MKPIFSIFNFLKGLKTTKFHDVPSGTAVKMYGKDADDNFVEDDVPSGGATAFTELSDVPQSYTDQAGKMLIVNEDETELEFTDVPSGGALPAGTVDGSVLRWYDTSEKWEESEHIKIYYDENDEADWIKIQNSYFRKSSYLSDNEIDNNNSQQINFCIDDLSAYLGVNINDYFDTIEQHLIDAGVYSQLENGEAYWQVSGRLKSQLYIEQTLTTENDLILCRVGGTGGIEVFKINELGKILSNYLAGTGNRPLYADESGNIGAVSLAGLSGSCTIDGQTLTFEKGILVGANPSLS